MVVLFHTPSDSLAGQQINQNSEVELQKVVLFDSSLD